MFPVTVGAGTSRVLSSMVHGLNAGRGKHTPVTGTVQGDGHNVCIAAARLHHQRGGTHANYFSQCMFIDHL
jgi:hypothetical protein